MRGAWDGGVQQEKEVDVVDTQRVAASTLEDQLRGTDQGHQHPIEHPIPGLLLGPTSTVSSTSRSRET